MTITPDSHAINNLDLRPQDEAQRSSAAIEIKAFTDLFFPLPDQQLYFKTEQGSKAITADRDQAVRSHLLGEELRYRLNYKGQPGKKQHRENAAHIGASPIGDGDRVTWIGIDLDAKGGNHKAGLADVDAVRRQIIARVHSLGMTAYWEVSGGGSGRHCWLFLSAPISAAAARMVGLSICPQDAPLTDGGVAEPHKSKAIEIFPKQNQKKLSGGQMLLPGWIGALPGRLRLRNAVTGEEITSYTRVQRCNEDAVQNAIEAALEDKAKQQVAEEEAKIAAHHVAQTAKKARHGRPMPRTVETPSAIVRAQARAYLATIEGAVQGKGGRIVTSRAACVLVLGYNLAPYDALDLLLSDYNPRCEPRWYPNELRAKVEWADSLSGERGYRILPSRGERLSAPVEILPQRYKQQTDLAKAKETASPKAFSLRDAEVPLRKALIAATVPVTAGPLLTVLKVSLGGGKSHQAREVIYQISRGLKDGECLVLCVPTHKLGIESYNALRALGADVMREFSPPTHPGCDEKEAAASEYPRGASGKDACLSCRRYERCPFTSGWEGTSLNPAIVITTHEAPVPKYALRKHIAVLVVDEEAPLVKGDAVSAADLMDLSRNTSISDTQRATLQSVAVDILTWRNNKGQGPSPLETRRGDLLYIASNGDASRAPVAKIHPKAKLPVLGSAERTMHQRAAAPAYRAGVWLLKAAIDGGNIALTKEGFVRHAQTPLARLIAARATAKEPTVILDASAGKTTMLHLSALTGFPPHKVEVVVSDAIPVHRYWIATGSVNRGKINDADNLRSACRRAAKSLEEEAPSLLKLLIGTFKAQEDLIVKALRGEGPPDCIKAVQPLRDLHARGVQIDIIHYGAVRGLDCFKDYDAAIALGSPYQSDDDLQHRVKALGLPPLTKAELEAWREELSAQELSQFFGRLRPTRAWGRSAITMICLAKTLPEDWLPSQTRVEHTKARPEAQPSQGWPELLRAAVERAGSPKNLEAALKGLHKPLSRRSIERYLAGASPAPSAEGAIKAYLATTATVSSFINNSGRLEREERYQVPTTVEVRPLPSPLNNVSLPPPDSRHKACSVYIKPLSVAPFSKLEPQPWVRAEVGAPHDRRGGYPARK